MKVLVTGGAGYVGSHACKALAAAGHEPIVLDDLSQGRAELARWGVLIKGDYTDPATLDAVFTQHRPQAVMHFAARSLVGQSVSDPGLYYRSNIAGGIELLDAMRRHGATSIVFSSSCAVYGVPEKTPIVEDTPKAPINPYGFTKLALEHALADYGRAYGLNWIALRYFNAAGADPDGEAGECHEPETHAIPLAIAAAEDGAPFKLFGEDYPTPDGTCIRDYIHVSDLATAHVAALEHLARGGESAAVNLGTGQGVSVREIIDAVGRAVGRPVPFERAPRRVGDPPELVAAPGLSSSLLNWTPTLSSMDDIARTAVAWYRKRKRP